MNHKKDRIEVSVLIPNFNYGKYIKQCIQSVINSDFDHAKLEIVIVDDASTDNSLEIIQEIKTTSKLSIRVIRNNMNVGLARTRNEGIKNAKGDYLFFLDSDNYIGTHCITKHVEFLSKNSNYGACYAPIQRFDDTTGDLISVFSNEPYDYETLRMGNYIDAMAMFRKSDLIEIGCYDTEMPYSGLEDYELWLRMGKNDKKVHFLNDEPLSYYRVHADSMMSVLSLSKQDKIASYIKMKYNIEELDDKKVEKINSVNPISFTTVKIFWAAEDGIFSEQQSTVQQVMLSWNMKKIVLTMPVAARNIALIRFDIGEQVGLLNIHGIEIKDSNSIPIWQWQPCEILSKENILFIKQETFWKNAIIQLSTNNDPQFIVKMDKLTDEVIDRGCTIEVSLSTLDNNQFNLLTKTLITPLSFVDENEKSLKMELAKLQIKNTTPNDAENYGNEKHQLLDHIETQKLIIQQIISDKESIATTSKQQIDALSVLKEKNEKELSSQIIFVQELLMKEKELMHSLATESERMNLLIAEKDKSETLRKEALEVEEQLKIKMQQLQIEMAREIEKNNLLVVEKNQKEIELKDSKMYLLNIQTEKSELQNQLAIEIDKKNAFIIEKEKESQKLLEITKTSEEQKGTIVLLTEKNNTLNVEKELNNTIIADLNKKNEKATEQNNNLVRFQENQLKTIENINSEKEELFATTKELINQVGNLTIELSSHKKELMEEKNKVDSLEKQITEYNNTGIIKFFINRFSNKK